MPSLQQVYADIEADPFWDYLRLPGVKFVPGYGSTRPKVLLVGEAPGATENARGRPFCGPSGRVLDGLMSIAGLRLDPATEEPTGHGDKSDPAPSTAPANAFVTNVVKYRPPGNATPNLAAIQHAVSGFRQERYAAGFKKEIDDSLPEGAGSLRAEWRALGGPKLIICVGSVAHTAIHPGLHGTISMWAGEDPRPARSGKVWVSSQFHPAYGLRNQNRQPRMERDWEALGNWIQERGILDGQW